MQISSQFRKPSSPLKPKHPKYITCATIGGTRQEVGCCYCCLPTPACLQGGVLPYFEVTGHPVPVSLIGFACPDCFIWNCSYIVYPSKMKGPFRDNCLRYYYLWLAFLMTGWVEGIRRALVLGLVLMAGTAIEQAPSVGLITLIRDIITFTTPDLPSTINTRNT